MITDGEMAKVFYSIVAHAPRHCGSWLGPDIVTPRYGQVRRRWRFHSGSRNG